MQTHPVPPPARCADGVAGRVESAGATSELRDGWNATPRREGPFDWDGAHSELTLRKRGAKFVAAGRQPRIPEDRAARPPTDMATFYWIDETLRACSSARRGTLNVSPFWPDARSDPSDEHGDFSDAAAKTPVRAAARGTLPSPAITISRGHCRAARLLYSTSSPGVSARNCLARLVPLDFARASRLRPRVLSADARYWALDQRFGVVAAPVPAK